MSEFDAPAFVPIVDSALNPIRKIKAPKTIGYCFTEWPLTDKAKTNSRQYDWIFTGSDWNTNKLKSAGIKHCSTLVQGVDFDRFNPRPPSQRNAFVVFSGGKYEFRKGQDYVLAAMKHFMRVRTDAVLLAAWHNPWPQSIQSMRNSWLINPSNPFDGLPEDRVLKIPAMPNEKTAEIYEQAHVGLFPNRCEAGTNMVMTEFMSCARPVIASCAHGHKDVLSSAALKLTSGSYDAAGWFNANVSDIINRLEYAYSNRAEMIERGVQCADFMRQFTWQKCAEKIVEKL
jgi:glycosyltransferase involved in cell wall biosynthesis